MYILCMKAEFTGSPKLLEIIDMTGFPRECIKSKFLQWFNRFQGITASRGLLNKILHILNVVNPHFSDGTPYRRYRFYIRHITAPLFTFKFLYIRYVRYITTIFKSACAFERQGMLFSYFNHKTINLSQYVPSIVAAYSTAKLAVYAVLQAKKFQCFCVEILKLFNLK